MPVTRTKAEGGAYEHLDAARKAAEPMETDGRDWQPGGPRTWVSAAKQLSYAKGLLKAQEIEVDFLGGEITGQDYVTTWRWRRGPWRSKPTTIAVMLDQELGPSSRCSAAVTAGRKIYTRQLLELEVVDDDEANLSRAYDTSLEALMFAADNLLTAACRRYNKDPGIVITELTGWRTNGGVTPTVGMLPTYLMGVLAGRLAAQLGIIVEPLAPDLDKFEQLPREMGGTG